MKIWTFLGKFVATISLLAPTMTNSAQTPPDFRPYAGDAAITATFSGSNVKLLYEYFVKSDERAAKGQFEKTEEYNARLANFASIIPPLNANDWYALRLRGTSAVYDADREIWSIKSIMECQPLGAQQVWKCNSELIRYEGESYIGQNAYGVRTRVDRRSNVDVRVPISENWMRNSKAFSFPSGSFAGLDITVPMRVNDARKYAGRPIDVYAVGKIFAPTLLIEPTEYDAPTISDPVRRQTTAVTLSILPQRLVLVARGLPGTFWTIDMTTAQ